MKKFNLYYYLTFMLLYFEILSKIIIKTDFKYILYTILFLIPLIIFSKIICSLFKDKINKIICFIITIILSIYYPFMNIFYRLFSNIFSFNTLSLAKDLDEFKIVIVDTIISNIFIIILFLIPLILLIIFHKKISFSKLNIKSFIINITVFIITYIISLLSLIPYKNSTYSAYNLYFNTNSEIKSVEKFGLLTYTRLDIKRIIFGFEEKIDLNIPVIDDPIEPDEPNEPEIPEEPVITYNISDINLEELINNTNDSNIKTILTYFLNTNPTNKNEYTGLFKGKNLIFILAEAFNSIAVSEELTPTLYKLTHEGFVFNNFYSPVFLSTTGGEFQATTGLIPTQDNLSNWKKYTPNIMYALGNSFKALGYNTQSYHNWTYTYYSRQKTMPTLGFDNYLGCGNGLEKEMNCKWLPSDIDLFNTTLPYYQDYDKFVTYYVTVSGHAPYAYNSTGNSIALKNINYVKNLPYSNNVKAYLATQIELDRALESLINNLNNAGILEDTVIALVGDHYPYTLTVNEINEISSYKRDGTIEVNRSNFIIWNPSLNEPIYVDKVGSQIDVLPTLLNLFGIDYDSRFIIGKDILSDEPGLAIFSNRSWVSDIGTYNNNHLTIKDNITLENEKEYINNINALVNSKFTISRNIIKYKIYDYLK